MYQGRHPVSARPSGARVLCRLDDLAVPGSKGFTLGEGAARYEIFLVRDDSGVYGYRNSCPHAGSMLDWVPDRFLSRDRKQILCATHGARFRIHDGFCVHGPCKGASLAPLTVAVVGGDVVVED